LTPTSQDSRWTITPEQATGQLQPGESVAAQFQASYLGSGVDEAYRSIDLVLNQYYLAPTMRYAVPEVVVPVPFRLELDAPAPNQPNKALALDGKDDAIAIASSALQLPDGPLTFEA